jgi:hypothetical protein
MGLSFSLSARQAALLTLRALRLLLATMAFVGATAMMPLADAIAITFVRPFFAMLPGHLIFGDEVGPAALRPVSWASAGRCWSSSRR